MATAKSYATERNWCVYCPDLIVEGETQITDPDLEDPFGDPGCAHADCAANHGWTVEIDHTDPNNDTIDQRDAFRAHVRDHGPIIIHLPED